MTHGVRIRFQKGEECRFLGHLDVLRTMDRAIRRAKIPVAYTQGFHPKAKVSFASALSVGVTSEAEYADIQLDRDVAPVDVQTKLGQALPKGLPVMEAVCLPAQTKALMAVVNAAEYRIDCPHAVHSELSGQVDALLAQTQVDVERVRKKGSRTMDIRPLIYELHCCTTNSSVYLKLLCASGSVDHLRPSEILSSLSLQEHDVRIHRTKLLVVDQEGRMYDPIEHLTRET